MLEIIFEDEYDTAAFLHLAEHLDSRHHMSIQQGKDRLLIEAKESGEAYRAHRAAITGSLFFGMQRKRAHAQHP